VKKPTCSGPRWSAPSAAAKSLFGNRYFSRALEEFHGERLRIGYDVNDASRVWVYADDGRLICTAEWNANVRSFFPVSVIEQARDRRAAGRVNRLQVHLEEVQAERRGQPAIEAQQEIVIPGVISGTREQLAEAAAQARIQRQPIAPKRCRPLPCGWLMSRRHPRPAMC
jgi:putative transposase